MKKLVNLLLLTHYALCIEDNELLVTYSILPHKCYSSKSSFQRSGDILKLLWSAVIPKDFK